jgi:hypothetical protein
VVVELAKTASSVRGSTKKGSIFSLGLLLRVPGGGLSPFYGTKSRAAVQRNCVVVVASSSPMRGGVMGFQKGQREGVLREKLWCEH